MGGVSSPADPAVVAIGNFDGLHLGHQAIFREAGQLALKLRPKLNAHVLAFTFHPHPRVVLKADSAGVEMLLTEEERLERFPCAAWIERFTPEFAKMSPEAFFETFLLKRISTKALVVGENFRFGRDRSGGVQELRALCDRSGIEFKALAPELCRFSGEPHAISSSAIRQAVKLGDVGHANAMLGYRFFYRGEVRPGDAHGRKIGFPTANFYLPSEKIRLKYGVYATLSVVNGRAYPSVTNFGLRPTMNVTDSVPRVETHLFDFSQNLYEKSLTVHFIERIRDEKKFSSVEELKAQIQADALLARQISGAE